MAKDLKDLLFVVTGPTASGKTSKAVALAKHLDAEIISADSRQLYRRMDLGTGKDLEEYTEEDFVFAYTDYTKVYFKNKYLITGHTPTVAINQKFMGKVYSKNGHIAIDCGAAYGGRLAAICLDALKLHYC